MNAESNTIIVAQPTNRVSPVRLGREQDAGMALFPPGQLPSTQIPADWNQTDATKPDYIKNKPEIPGKPSDIGAAAAQHSHAQSDVTGLVDALAGKASTADATLADLYNYRCDGGTLVYTGNAFWAGVLFDSPAEFILTHTSAKWTLSLESDVCEGFENQDGSLTFDDLTPYMSEVLGGESLTLNRVERAYALGSQTDKPLAPAGDYVQKSQTAGLLKNDGSVDTNTYLTAHQEMRYALASPAVTPSGTAASATLQDRAVNTVSLGASVESAAFTLPAATAGRARDFFLRLVTAGTAVATVTFTDPATSASVDVEIGADELADWNTAGTRLVLFTEIAANKWLVSKKEAAS